MDHTRIKKQEIIIGLLVLGCVILLALNSTQFFARIDMTEDKVFTFSPVTLDLVRSLPQQLHISYYISNKLRQVSPVPGQIIDILQEYSAVSRGRIKVSIVDPLRGQAAEAVRRFGIYPQQMKIIKQNEQQFVEVFSGLVFEYLDRTVAIPFVFNPQTLEYSLTLTIRRIVRNTPTIVSVIVGNPSKSFQQDFSMLSAQLSMSFELRDIVPGAAIPPETSVLVVLGGEDLPAKDLLPIDQFIMGGGHTLFAVKALKIDTKVNLDAVPVESSALLSMLAQYGIDVGKAMVLDPSCRHYRLPQNNFGQLQWMDLGKYPEWVSVLPENVSLTNPITRRFSGLDLLWPSPLRFNGRSSVKAEVIAKSTKDAWLMKPPFQTDPFYVSTMTGTSDSSRGQYALAYALTGRFSSYFAGSNPVASQGITKATNNSGASKAEGDLGASSKGELLSNSPESRMIVVGDVDFASDLMQFSDSAYNTLFIENAVEWLSADADLLSMKTRNYHDPRLSRIQDPSLRNALIVLAESVNIVLMPLLVLVFGIVRAYSRREKMPGGKNRQLEKEARSSSNSSRKASKLNYRSGKKSFFSWSPWCFSQDFTRLGFFRTA